MHRFSVADIRRDRSKVATAVAIVLGSCATLPAWAEGDQSQEMQDLRQQVQELQREMRELKAERQQAASQSAAPAQSAAAAQAPVAGAAPASGAAPAASNAPPSPGIHAGPLTVTLGGFTELTGIYRNRNETADVGSNFNTGIPFPNSSQSHLSETRASARQSRLSLLTQGPQSESASAEAYFELDFLGAAPTANSIESNSYNPRMRQIYGLYNRKDKGFYVLAGQSFSLATLMKKGIVPRQENIPLTIDPQYVPGFNWTRNAQLRIVKNLGNELAFGVSLESPQAIVFNGPNAALVTPVFNSPGGSFFAPTTSYSEDVAPDVIAKMAWDPGFGHYELYGMGRAFRDRAGGSNETVLGGGVGGGAILPLAKQLDVQASFLAGSGIGRYGSAQLPDVTVKPDGRLDTISEYDAMVGLVYRPTSSWTLYSYAGIEHADSKSFTATVNGKTLGYGYGSSLYDNSGCLIEGSQVCAANTSEVQQATVGGWWKYYQGTLGNMQLGFQGSYTRRKTFSGIGGNPTADLTVGMVSFRYYPYQQ